MRSIIDLCTPIRLQEIYVTSRYRGMCEVSTGKQRVCEPSVAAGTPVCCIFSVSSVSFTCSPVTAIFRKGAHARIQTSASLHSTGHNSMTCGYARLAQRRVFEND